uniref:Apple domain-containing protein n=1 Tax=Acrobeloides nanus TaxID=290746 RepID=A0A914CBQ8_9BILA
MDLVFEKLFQYFILIGFFIRVFCADDNDSIPRPQYQLNRCFTYKPNSRLKIDEDQVVETTDSIEFKDDCLRSCLKSLIHEAFVCRSLMHTPKDDGCKLTTSNSEMATLEQDRKGSIFDQPHNYYENECAKFPLASAIVQAKLYGYRGGEGVVQVAQRNGEFASFMAVLDQLDPNKTYRILYTRETIKDCFKEKVNDLKKLQRLASIVSDSTGMAVQPWTEISWFDILSGDIVDTTILLVDTHLETVFDCGHFTIRGDTEEFERIRNTATKSCYMSLIIFFVLLFVMF